jgi:hypothetical protein
MQTFLPLPDYRQTAKVLDYRRLGKQRSECRQILTAIEALNTGTPYGWTHHPVVKMWRWWPECLKLYYNTIVTEWEERGYKNNLEKFRINVIHTWPPWIDDWKVYSSHRANLLRKDPKWYGQFGWTEKPEEGYYWPI